MKMTTAESEAWKLGYREAFDRTRLLIERVLTAAVVVHARAVERVARDLIDSVNSILKDDALKSTFEKGDRVRLPLNGAEYTLLERGEGGPDSRGEYLSEGWWKMVDDAGEIVNGSLPEADIFLVRKADEQ